MADTPFVSDKPMTFSCDLDLGRGNINFVHDTHYHFALPFCEDCINSVCQFLSYG